MKTSAAAPGVIVLLFLQLGLTHCSAGRTSLQQHEDPHRASLAASVDALLGDSLLAPVTVGIAIARADTRELLYERDSRKLLHPASNMKLLTTATALHLLPADFAYTTVLATDTLIAGRAAVGNLLLRGSGDPMLTTADLDSLAAGVQMRGITAVEGDLIGDVSFFDTVAWGSGWMWDDEPYADEAFITPLAVNGNAVEVAVTPGARRGDRPAVRLTPDAINFPVVNEAITSDDTLLPALDVTRLRLTNTIVVTGRIAPGAGEHTFGISVWRPERYVLALVRQALEARGITVRGTLAIDSTGEGMPLASVTHPIDSVLHQVNKPSDNLAAECLLKTLDATLNHRRGTAAGGLAFVREHLGAAGVDTALTILADGSGVSWYNAVAAADILKLLLQEYDARATYRRWYESLPVGGIDGTLKSRMKGSRAEGNVHAKTGSLTGVSCLSGYVTSIDGAPVAFSILCSHFPGDIAVLRTLQDRIVELLANTELTTH